MAETRRYRARWVIPVDGEPLENGVVEITDGLVTALHDRPDRAAEDLGNAAIIPALVNAHTHLEFSDVDEPFEPARPFTAWIRRLMRYRGEREIGIADAVRLGRAESQRAGVGLLGEIATEGWSPEVFNEPGPDAVVFRELIGLGTERIEQQLAIAREHVSNSPVPTERGPSTASGGESSRICRGEPDRTGWQSGCRGLSPHAPYTVHPDLYHALVDLAVERRVPLAIHLAETVAELELLDVGSGEIAEMLREFGVWNDTAFRPGTHPLAYLEPLAKLDRALVVHGNYLSNDELALLAAHPQLTLVFCPRTHAHFGHAGHPWRELLAAGGSVAIGTDGRGSNPDLSVWAELQFLRRRFPDFDPRTLLGLGTRAGARALGRDATHGTITVGRTAHLAVVRLPPGDATEPHTILFDGSTIARPAPVGQSPARRDAEPPPTGSRAASATR